MSLSVSRRVFLAGTMAVAASAAAAAAAPLRIGALKFGTLNWLIETIQAEGLDGREGFAIERVDYASGQATTVGLQADDLDLIVSDWLWAMRLRAEGEDLRFAPFSNALGALMVARDGPVRTLADLKGRRLGVAGGALDKSWLLLRAYGRSTLGGDLSELAEPVYGAAPLVVEQLKLGRVDAVLAFWPFAARLEAAGYRRLLDMDDVARGLGIDPPAPLVGFVWRQRTMAAKAAQLDGFFRAVAAANAILKRSDAAWERLRPQMAAADEAEFRALRGYFRAGVPGPFGAAQLAACARLYDVLADIGGMELVGPNPRFDRDLFWLPPG